jgi:hypothetical protein
MKQVERAGGFRQVMASSLVPDCSPLSRTIAPTWDRGSKQMLLVNPGTQPLCVIRRCVN